MLVCALSQESEDTALTIAAYKGHEKVVRLLLQRGANIDHQVGTAFLSCIVSGALSLGFCGFVLMSGLRCNVYTSGILLKHFYPLLCIQGVYGQTALHSASANNHIKVVEVLLVGVDAVLWLYLLFDE